MALYVVMRPSDAPNNEELEQVIIAHYADDYFKISEGQWLISSGKTVIGLCQELGIEKGSGYSATLVVAFTTYYGLHNSQLWDWIKTKLEAAGQDG